MDDLLHFVRYEVAMDGDDGTPIDRLDSFIHTYYARAAEDSSNGSASIKTQNIDESFKDFIWKQLASLPELTVAFLRKVGQNDPVPAPSLDEPEASTSAVPAVSTPNIGSLPRMPLPESQETDRPTEAVDLPPLPPLPPADYGDTSKVSHDEEGNIIDQGALNLKNKEKIKASRKDNQKRDRDARLDGHDDQYEFVEIQDEEIQSLNRTELSEKYGNTLRIAADPETCYVALTGSHERFGKLTNLAYQVLQAIARGRENGKTVVELGKEFEHDQKSLFHFVKSLVELNLIVKMKVLDARSQTSRCIHRHYLETSQHWATWMTKDPNQDAAKGEEDDDDLSKTTPLTLMTVAHLNSNEPLVRSRIINALRNAPENLIPHVDLVFAIGFHARPDREHRRRLNRIITSMDRQGLVEKVGVARQGAKGLLSCLKLRTDAAQDGGENMGTRSLSEEDEVEQRPNVLLTLPVERQVVDLLVSSGAQGLTIREVQAGLGDVGIRSLETLLTRKEKGFEPPHLCDYRIHSVYETHGREKRLRYFTTAGYHERCRLDGIGDIANMNDFTHPDLAGGFAVLDTSDFYSNPEEFAKMAEKMLTNTRPGAKYGSGKGKRKANAREQGEPVKLGRPKGSTKKAKEAKLRAENGEPPLPDAGDTGGAAEAQKTNKNKRQKKDKVDGEEGQPPKKKAKSKKSQQGQEGQGDQADTSMAGSVAGPSGTSGVQAQHSDALTGPAVPEPKKKGRPRKSATSMETRSIPGTPVPIEGGVDPGTGTPAVSEAPTSEGVSMQEISTPQPKKKGRPPKVHSEDDPRGTAKKRKAEIGPDGQPIKGRPRKYPPGTTSAQRRILLEERRAAGLEPPSKKQKSKPVNGEDGSAGPSDATPGIEDIPVPGPLSDGQDVSSAQVPVGTESFIDQSAHEQAITVLEGLSASIVTPADNNSIDHCRNRTEDQKPNQENTPNAVSEDIAITAQNAPFAAVVPCHSRPVSTDKDTLPSTDAAHVDITASEGPATASLYPVSQRGREMATSEQASLQDEPSVDANAKDTQATEHARVAEETPASLEPAAAEPTEDTPARRSTRQTAGRAPKTPITRLRRGRSSKILSDDVKVKIEEAAADTIGENSTTPPPASDTNAVGNPQQDRLDAPIVANEQPNSAEARVETDTANNLMPEAEEPAASAELPNQNSQVAEVAPSIAPLSEVVKDPVFGHENEPYPLPSAVDEGDAVQLSQPAPNSNAMPIDLPAMPEPLPAAVKESHAGPDSASFAIAPNVIAKPMDDAAPQDKVVERRNHSMQVHENEYLATLQDVGGIAEDGVPLNKLWQDCMQRKNPNKPAPKLLDRRTMKGIATSLEKRGLVKRSILQFQNFDGKMIQRPIMYLSNISLDSPQMREFALSMQDKMEGNLGGAKNWLAGRKTLDKTDEMAVAPRRARRPVADVPTDPRSFFMKNWRIVAQHFGWQYGFLARARTLHIHLISSVTDKNDSTFILSSDPRVRIFASPFVLLDTPLSVFMQVAAVSEYSAELEEFLKQQGTENVSIKDLPPTLSGLFGAQKAKGYSRFSQLFGVLMLLKLLVPIEQVDYETPIVAYSGVQREPRYFAARQERSGATYWLLPNQAPLYDLQEKKASEQKLLGQLPIQTPDQAIYFWDTMHKLTFGYTQPESLPQATVNWPPTLNAPPRFIHAARTSSHWRAEYLLLAQQKTYLRRSLEEVAAKDALLSDDAKIEELARNVCAPANVVRAYYAKPHLGARPEWLKKRKRRPNTRQESDESGTSASEAEGSAAPLPRSQRTDQAKAARKRAEKAAREAEKARKQREIIDMKARGVSAAKEAVWKGIINGFRLQHGEEALKVVQLDFLHNWFLSSEGPTATTVQQHLEQAVEGVQTAPITIPSRAVLAPKTGSVANRGSEKRMKTKLRRREAANTQEARREDEIVLSGLPELPEVVPSGEKKSPKSGWTPQEDEQLMDLYVILQNRANDRDTKLSMEPATLFYPDAKAKLLLDRLRNIAMNPGEVAYLDALQDAWSRLWYNGRIRDPLLHDAARNVSKEGLILLRRVLNGVLNKRALRFQALMPAEAATASQTRLPADPCELKKSFLLEFKTKPEDPESPQTWEYLWSMITTAQKLTRFNYQPFRTQYEPRLSASPSTSQQRADLFMSRYRPFAKIPANYLKDAEAFEMRLVDEGVVDWSPICEDGDMLAMAHLFSENLLTLSVDTAVTQAGRPYTDYRTRKIDDDNFENTLIIQPNQDFLNRTQSLFTPEIVKLSDKIKAQ
ncbi:hypothetical protein P389DRAFT_197696 [Cystobasidium minutum MCA 4210]|uniref:uncharacterized protein n=1 Tax=Cystobasidium minutum MCA 4210 TaxID=1397322 RepID=UPI0034CD5A11|eukprot:jgi/Rhomi1/197696/gm1.5910_g